MNWYNGSIVDAIKAAKTRKAIFVVYTEGNDENSQLMSEVVSSGEICTGLSNERFVAIKLSADDVGYKQFVEIYKLVPIPSLFFIGDSGAPIDIVAADNSRLSLETKIKAALGKCNIMLPENSNNSPISVDSKGPSTSQTESQETPKSNQQDNPENDSTLEAKGIQKPSLNEKVEIAKKLLEKKKEEKEVKEIEDEKTKEFERRRVGQEMMKAKKQQQDRELREMIEEREREKRESAAAKQRILEQIAQDRAERAERERRMKGTDVPAPSNQSSNPIGVENRPLNVDETRIQFKLPTGEARTHSFPPKTTLLQVRDFINGNIELSFRDYRLATTFPRREFTREDDECTLSALNLIPTGVILILPLADGNVRPYTRDWFKIVNDLFWDMVQPIFSVANYIQSYFSARPSNNGTNESSGIPPQQPPSQTSRTVVRRSGNIHSLKDMRDENDENNTWNGNSTQQM